MSLQDADGCPASTLPTEVLREILWGMFDWFELSADLSVELRPLERYKWLSSFMLVCKRWRAIVIDFPDLWCTITSDCHPTLMSHIMERSRGRLLNVDCRSDSTPERRAQVKNLVDHVAPHAHRCESLLLDSYGEPEEYFLPLLTNAAPQLRHLDLRWTVPGGEPQMDLFSKIAVRLTVLYLVSAEVVWSSPIFSNLEVLSLMSISRGPTVLELVRLIKSSPCLQTLGMEDVALTHDDDQEWPVWQEPLILPSLQQLVVDCDYGSNLRWEHVLSQFTSIPSCQTLTLNLDCAEEDPQIKLSALFGLHTDLARIYSAAGTVRPTCHNTTFVQIVADSVRVAFRGDLDAPVLYPVLEWAANLFGFPSDPRASIKLRLGVPDNIENLLPLNQYRVEEIELDNAVPANFLLLRALAGTGTGAWAGTFAFPNMRVLRIQVHDIAIEPLLEMLHGRWEVVQSPEASVQAFKVSFAMHLAQAEVMHLVADVIGQENVLYHAMLWGSDGLSETVREAFQAESPEDVQ